MQKNIFSERIKELRRNSGKTQKEFSAYLGIMPKTLSGYERGAVEPSLKVAQNIAEKCSVSVDWLCGRQEKSSPAPELETVGDAAEVLLQVAGRVGIMCYVNGTFAFQNGILNVFMSDLVKMYELKVRGTITQDMYKSWIHGKIDSLKEIKLDDQEAVDSYLNNLYESEERLVDESGMNLIKEDLL